MESKGQMLENELSMSDLSINADLKEKINLLKQYSNENAALKNQKSDLDSLSKNQSTVDETISQTKKNLSKEIKEKNKKIIELNNLITNLLMNSSPYVNTKKLDRDIVREISKIVNRDDNLKRIVKEGLPKEIAKLYELKEGNYKTLEKQTGIQKGFIINDNATGLKLFIKESTIFEDTKSVDPRELFAYKVLEYMQLGPETLFFISAISSSSTGARICHIITKDEAYSDNPNITKVFFTDNFINKENPNSGALTHWQVSLEDKEFRTKFITLSIVNDLLHLNDTLETNAWNYGSILQKSKTNETQHKGIAAIIDFEIRDSLFKYEPEQNPLISLMEKLGRNADNNNYIGELISYKLIKEWGYFKNAESELSEAIKYVNENFIQVIKKAEEEINNLMSKFKEFFSNNARSKFKEYLTQTKNNIKMFSEGEWHSNFTDDLTALLSKYKNK